MPPPWKWERRWEPCRATIGSVAGIDADFEDGVLRPVRPLTLRPGERVRLIVIRRPDRARWDLNRLAARPDEDLELAEAGLPEWAEALDSQDRR